MDDLTRRAVDEERVRLAADIEAVVRAAVTRIVALAATAERDWAHDPVPALRRAQDEGRHATDELHRLRGLFDDAATGDSGSKPHGEPSPGRPTRTDAALAAGAAVLAVVEYLLYDAAHVRWYSALGSALVTAAAAATIGLRRAPAAGAALCGLAFLGGAVADRSVDGGFWMVVSVGGLAWAAAAHLTWWRAGGLLVLLGGIVVARFWRDPESLPLDATVVIIGAAAGAFVGLTRARRPRARTRAERRAARRTDAVRQAVRGERLDVARGLHTELAHAVGVLVLEAGTAQMLCASDPARARAALDIVARTGRDTLSTLDKLGAAIRAGAMGRPAPAGGAPHRDADALRALVERMRAAGLRVRLSLAGPLDGDVATAVYRIVQESLTNVLRCAPGARVRVTATVGASGTAVTVTDDGPGPAGPIRRDHGLIGIAQRVHRLGGHLGTGAGPDGVGFRIEVRLPARQDPDGVAVLGQLADSE